MSPHYGRSDRIRTCGILLPKQARYQLRYTPIFYFAFFLKFSVFPCFVRPLAKCRPWRCYATLCALFCCASSGSLHLPPAAVAFVTQSRRATNCATPRFFYFAFFIIFSVLPCFVRRHTASTSRSRHLCYFNISGRVCQAGDWAGNCGVPSALMHTQRKTPPLWLTPGRWYSLGAKISLGTAGWTGSGHRYPAARLRWSCLRSLGA